MNSTGNFVTVVFKHSGNSNTIKGISKAFKDGSNYGDLKITAMSLRDEISEIEKLENDEGK